DEAVEQAVRAFQQQRGLITDGIVGPATYRALTDARWRLGDRPLAYMVSKPLSGDDVFALQERLLELGYDARRPDGIFGRQTEQPCAASSGTTGSTPTASADRPPCAPSSSSPPRCAAADRCSCGSRRRSARRVPGCAASASSSTPATAAATAEPPWATSARRTSPGTSPAGWKAGWWPPGWKP